jgi:hypothetical protein
MDNVANDCDGIWKMNFDGDRSRTSVGVVIIFTTPKCELVPYSHKLEFDYSDYVTKYESLLLGLESTMEMKINKFKGSW